MNEVQQIAIRSVQHYLYCPHRWGLLEIDKAWAENVFVTKANLMHDRVHDPERHYSSRGKKVFTSVPVYNDLEAFELYGVTDCIEVTEKKQSADRKFCIVEYKPTKPKDKEYNEDDFMQVFAQKICVDYVFKCDSDAALYYADVKKRVKLPVRENFEENSRNLQALLWEMRNYLQKGVIPPIRKGQKCSGCSMKDLCMPSVKKKKDLRSQIKEIWESES